MKIDLDQIRDLLKAVSNTDITELTIESGDEKITVKKSTTVVTVAQPSMPIEINTAQVPQVAPRLVAVPPSSSGTSQPNNHKNQDVAAVPDNYVSIASPMVGTFYRSPSPTAPSYVDVGDTVKVGQTVCIIEAMKLMNDLPSEVSGKVVKILVENGTTVEFGQPLFLVDPNG